MTINIQCGCCLLSPPTFWALRFRLARIAPYAFPFRRMLAISPLPGNIFALCMLFEIVMARSSPHASISRCNQAIRNAWRGNLAVKDRFSRRDARNHAWRMILAMGIAPPLRSALGMCRHGPSRAPGETLVSTERIPGEAHFWIACWTVWVSGRCGIVQTAFSKLQLRIGGRVSSRVLLPKKRRHFEGNVGCCVRRSHGSITFL